MQIRGMLKGLYRYFIFNILSSFGCLLTLSFLVSVMPSKSTWTSEVRKLRAAVVVVVSSIVDNPLEQSFQSTFAAPLFFLSLSLVRYFSWQLILTTRKSEFEWVDWSLVYDARQWWKQQQLQHFINPLAIFNERESLLIELYISHFTDIKKIQLVAPSFHSPGTARLTRKLKCYTTL